ncbi:hypothetical protein OH783_01710 [Kocuria rhizophila]|uniref:hypothetical protein n=1 Tax=Kocuria rhizophila TaxID=72000 RepID=UPI00386C60BF|nr:hypothetical protein OH783_01710 [Kocuria rhizophila]WSZ54153.1 hypothetical protein OG926_01710 [Kocuria rhizophila]
MSTFRVTVTGRRWWFWGERFEARRVVDHPADAAAAAVILSKRLRRQGARRVTAYWEEQK